MDLKNGNLITPKGASLIFGTKSNADHTNVEYNEEESNQRNPYIPYTIVIDEEDDEQLSIPAEQVIYNDFKTELDASNAQQAIERVNEKINNAHTNLKDYIDSEYDDLKDHIDNECNDLKSYIDGPVVRNIPITNNASYLRGIIVSTSAPPSDPNVGNIGDLWLVYENSDS